MIRSRLINFSSVCVCFHLLFRYIRGFEGKQIPEACKASYKACRGTWDVKVLQASVDHSYEYGLNMSLIDEVYAIIVVPHLRVVPRVALRLPRQSIPRENHLMHELGSPNILLPNVNHTLF